MSNSSAGRPTASSRATASFALSRTTASSIKSPSTECESTSHATSRASTICISKGMFARIPKLSGTAYNVFGIQVGVGITIAVAHSAASRAEDHFSIASRRISAVMKSSTGLANAVRIKSGKWKTLKPTPTTPGCRFAMETAFAGFVPLDVKSERRFRHHPASRRFSSRHSPGVNTGRDSVVYDFNDAALKLADRRILRQLQRRDRSPRAQAEGREHRRIRRLLADQMERDAQAAPPIGNVASPSRPSESKPASIAPSSSGVCTTIRSSWTAPVCSNVSFPNRKSRCQTPS